MLGLLKSLMERRNEQKLLSSFKSSTRLVELFLGSSQCACLGRQVASRSMGLTSSFTVARGIPRRRVLNCLLKLICVCLEQTNVPNNTRCCHSEVSKRGTKLPNVPLFVSITFHWPNHLPEASDTSAQCSNQRGHQIGVFATDGSPKVDEVLIEKQITTL